MNWSWVSKTLERVRSIVLFTPFASNRPQDNRSGGNKVSMTLVKFPTRPWRNKLELWRAPNVWCEQADLFVYFCSLCKFVCSEPSEGDITSSRARVSLKNRKAEGKAWSGCSKKKVFFFSLEASRFYPRLSWCGSVHRSTSWIRKVIETRAQLVNCV